MTVDELHDLFCEAAETDRWLPRATRRAALTYWPDTQASRWGDYANVRVVVRLTPSSTQIDSYSRAIDLGLLLGEEERGLVWAVAFSARGRKRGPAWSKLAKRFRCDRRTVKSRYLVALVERATRLR